jgi:hypothetical protein
MNTFEAQDERFREKYVEDRGSNKEEGKNCMIKSFISFIIVGYHNYLSREGEVDRVCSTHEIQSQKNLV